ncbi:RNase adapter RapZ [Marinilabiliaceae bacterium ANBcel2]|nr:RNase adapter RapZ [Marinilabiliaceae bacterium ANBcel2]
MKQEVIERLKALYTQWAAEPVISITPLPPSGSYREYFRISGRQKTVMGAINADLKENRAFIEFSRFFHNKGVRVPEIYAVDAELDCYLLEDFGNTTLFDWLSNARKNGDIPGEIIQFYKKTLDKLIDFQLIGKEIDFSLCYPRSKFDKQSMLWDLHYFKYYFLKLAKIPFDEQLLEDDFNYFADYLLNAETNYFLYRDFQSRNVMVVNNEPAFIDYQGGRKGALQYDLASLLFDAKADIPADIREELLEYYITRLSQNIKINKSQFRSLYNGYVVIRIMQAMGAYGFRGFYEKKEHFLKSIPYALKNLKYILEKFEHKSKFPELTKALQQVAESERLKSISEPPALTVSINSFSFKRGVPVDYSGNGGGFVFDCRAIHNPGKYDQYKNKTGKDPEVIAFFEKEDDIHNFIDNVYTLVSSSIEKYIERNFTHLMINFGCTGGRHRSVYSAEALAVKLKHKYPVNIKVRHLEQELKSD